MKILLVHNFYGSAAPSGENEVFRSERVLLEQMGHEVREFVRHSDTIRSRGRWGELQGALSTPWNPWVAAEIRRVVNDFRPDVVHAHNTFPLISPSIFAAIGNKAARVLTLHNYRIFCPAAIPMRNDSVCTECLDSRSSLPSVRHGCYRGSILATLPMALSTQLHRRFGTWTKHVDAFVALSEFQSKRMVESGLPADRVHVKPNFYPGDPKVIPWHEREDYVTFAGRLTPEKGVEPLIKAWLLWNGRAPELRVLGHGYLRDDLERLAAAAPEGTIRFLGHVSSQEAQAHIARAKLVILPSVCFETFGMVILEAFAFGTPVAVSNIGPLPSIVRHGVNGMVFEPGDVQSLLSRVSSGWNAFGLLERLAAGARASFETHYTARANYARLMEIYSCARGKPELR